MRASGILMHISSLPQSCGIGTLGREAYRFVDFLQQSHQKYWQVLPLCPTEEGDSPYQSSCVFAGNPYFIDLDFLQKEGLLLKEEIEGSWGDDVQQVDFELLRRRRLPVLYRAYQRFRPNAGYRRFCRLNEGWLCDYALFCALREQCGAPWTAWSEPLRTRDKKALKQASEELVLHIDFYKFLQFKFYEQWGYLKRYANRRGIKIIGDLPIYVAADSCDVWANQELFWLDPDGCPTAVAGCPPDAFSSEGQLWNNPLYRWDRMKRSGYRFWVERVRQAQTLFDVIRIDHFRGLESYYSIPAGDPTAEHGHWEKGPGVRLFRAIERKLGRVEFLAEDLGMLTPQVHELRERLKMPGMRILQFAFSLDEESTYLPHNCIENTVVYTGTHDNNTALGWFDSLSAPEQQFVLRYIRAKDRSELSWALIGAAWGSTAQLAVAQMQDVLDLGAQARMNTPATVGQNWKWRMLPGAADCSLAHRLAELTDLYFRSRNER